MRKICAVMVLFALAAGRGDCLELKHGRASYAPIIGATRPTAKFLPGDYLFYAFDIEKLTAKEKTGIVVYQQTMEIYNKKNDLIEKQVPPPLELAAMVGAPIHSYAHYYLRPDTTPGEYRLKVTVSDRAVNPPVTKELTYNFEVLKPAFGIVAASAPAVQFAGQDLPLQFAVVVMKRDEKTKMPDIDIQVNVLDESGKPAFAMPFTTSVKDLHVADTFDVTKMPVVPVPATIAMSRVGRFTIEIRANDKLGKEERTLRLPVTVLDPTPFLGAGK